MTMIRPQPESRPCCEDLVHDHLAFRDHEAEATVRCPKCGRWWLYTGTEWVSEDYDNGEVQPLISRDAQRWAVRINVPTEQWAGSCYAVACAFVQTGLKGTPRYGHWTGPVSRHCQIDRWVEQSIIHHGWVEMPDGIIVDPTRWVFEAAKPYIYVGENDYYDVGGNKLREEMLSPYPKYDRAKAQKHVDFGEATEFVRKLTRSQRRAFTIEQLCWIANLPLSRLGTHAKRVYSCLIAADLAGMIPIDNRRFVLGDR